MPRSRTHAPSYRLHRPSGQAVVTLSGKDHYLGKHGSKESRAAYDRLVGRWQANGRQLIAQGGADLTIAELVLAFWRHAEVYYRKDGAATSHLRVVKIV